VDDLFISPCNGETIRVRGTIRQQINLAGPGDEDFTHLRLEEVFSASGTGQTTGVSYAVHANHHIRFNSPTPEALQTTFTERDRLQFNASVPGLSFVGVFLIHLIDLPGGEVEKVTRESNRWSAGAEFAASDRRRGLGAGSRYRDSPSTNGMT